MKYISVCSGIEAASVAWEPLGWEPVCFAEIEKFPSEVLKKRWPDVPNLGDFTAIDGRQYRGKVDMLVGGTPCQGFSVAGLRKGLSDDRSNLCLQFVRLADEIRAPFIVWENVPGVLSMRDNAFGAFLGGLAGEDCELHPSGKRWTDAGCVFGPKRTVAWRVLDAEYFGVAQRRKRVFVIACNSEGHDPIEILFEWDSLRRDTPPRRGTKKKSSENSEGTPQVASALLAGNNDKLDTTRMTYVIEQNPVAFYQNGSGEIREQDHFNALQTNGNAGGRGVALIRCENFVRRLTPVECERLQGFPDGHTDIKTDCPDGPRYKALGNSMCVNVMRWIGQRIQIVEDNRSDA